MSAIGDIMKRLGALEKTVAGLQKKSVEPKSEVKKRVKK